MEQPPNSLIYDRTQADVTKRTPKGYWNAEDLSRIERWVLFLRDELLKYGYKANITPYHGCVEKSEYINKTGTVAGAKIETYVAPVTGTYEFDVAGARGAAVTELSSVTGVSGKGARIQYTANLVQGTVLYLLPGRFGTSVTNVAANIGAFAGGGGGMSAVFRQIPKITDRRYQFEKDGIYLEPLIIAAGGGGFNSLEPRDNTHGGHGQGKTYIHPNNFKPYSTLAGVGPCDGVMGITQFINHGGNGAVYEQNGTKIDGGFGCGGVSAGPFSYGGGWCEGDIPHSAASWCISNEAIGEDGYRTSYGWVRFNYKGVSIDWQQEEFPTYAEINRIRLNINRLRSGFYAIPEWRTLGASLLRGMNFEHANAMEWDLQQIYDWLNAMVNGFWVRQTDTMFMQAGGVLNR